MRIPLLSTPDKPIVSTTQELIPVADIKDGIVIYKNGGAALIMESTSLNFSLLSEREQEAIIASYAGLLNSFKFPVQIVVRSQTKDITKYMDSLDEARKKIQNPLLQKLLDSYQGFIRDSIKKRNVLSKSFYIVVPFTPYELGVAKSTKSVFKFGKGIKPLPFPKSYVIRKARISLYPKRDHLMRQAQRMGIRLRQLNDEEIIKLFWGIYNPTAPNKEQVVIGNQTI
ncbi:MAG: hypothetical protein US39_C0012G0011 [Microgenomates group bacterium GW2011_GWC1_37_12b]|nr:MAG: hypothetical protein US39_C0012G0011 [Microgenomates group bacterium GW2011_GWC1_37_12b]